MSIESPWGVILAVALVLIVLGAAAGQINYRAWVSEPLICTALGVLIGPVGLGLLHVPVGSTDQATAGLRIAARITLAIAVIGAAMRLPIGWLRANWRGLGVALGPLMLAMWGLGSLATWLVFRLPLLPTLLVGAIITPTDPVLASPLTSGQLAEENLPPGLRMGLIAESGANDGLALPFVMLPVLLLHDAPGKAARDWLLDMVLRQVLGGIAIGAVLGWASCWILRRFLNRYSTPTGPTSVLSVTLALAMAALAGARMAEADGILAAFAAGVVLNGGLRGEIAERQEMFNDATGRLFDLPVMVLFGAALPVHEWLGIGWPALAFVAAVLLLRRLPALLLLGRFMPWARDLPSAAFVGWFGPVGVSAVFYATDAQLRTGLTALWPLVSLVVTASVVAFGLSATPFTRMLGRQPQTRAQRRQAAEQEARR